MKATLEFDLDDFDDREIHLRCITVDKYIAVLEELKSELRSILKYDTMDTDLTAYQAIEHIQDVFYKLLNDNNLEI